jgi:hypothetical protein
MAGTWWEDLPSLRGLFPSIVGAAATGATTAGVWDAIRESAAGQATAVLSITLGRQPTPNELATATANYLSGIDAAAVSQARGAAGAFVTAHRNLLAQSPDEQILANSIARPPWATTTNLAGVNEQYRIRVLRSITVHGFTDIQREEWSSYNLEGTLTTANTALNQANTLFGNADYNRNVDINAVLDYVVEAV